MSERVPLEVARVQERPAASFAGEAANVGVDAHVFREVGRS